MYNINAYKAMGRWEGRFGPIFEQIHAMSLLEIMVLLGTVVLDMNNRDILKINRTLFTKVQQIANLLDA